MTFEKKSDIPVTISTYNHSAYPHSLRDIWRHVFREYTPCETENTLKDSSAEYVRCLLRYGRHVIRIDTDYCLFLQFSAPTGN